MLTTLVTILLSLLLQVTPPAFNGRVVLAGDMTHGKQVVCAATNNPPKFECKYQGNGGKPYKFWEAVILKYKWVTLRSGKTVLVFDYIAHK